MKNAHPPIKEVSALDKPHSNSCYPAQHTQAARLLAALLDGHQINPLWGWTKLGIYRLSATVFRLRKMGWAVKTGRLKVRNRFGEDCSVALYYLPNLKLATEAQARCDFVTEELHALILQEA